MSSNIKFVVTIIVGSILFKEPMGIKQVLSIISIITGWFLINYLFKNVYLNRQIFFFSKGLFLYSCFKVQENNLDKNSDNAKQNVEMPMVGGDSEQYSCVVEVKRDVS